MKLSIITTVAACVAVLAFQVPARAQNLHSWVASNGNNANDCSRASPCADFTGAFSKTAAGGEITCVDGGNYLGALITRSLTINCEGVAATNANGLTGGAYFIVNVAATDTVILRGVDVDLAGNTNGFGVQFLGAGTLIVDRSKFNGGFSRFGGVKFTPNGPGKLVMTDSIVANFGDGSAGAGIQIIPNPGGTAQVTLERVKVSGNTFGIAADGSGSNGGINMTVRDSVLASNANDGLVATTTPGGAPIGVLVSGTASTNNGYGIRSIGATATVRVKNSDIAGNGTGVSGLSGGALLTFGNNRVRANGANGAFTGSEALQ